MGLFSLSPVISISFSPESVSPSLACGKWLMSRISRDPLLKSLYNLNASWGNTMTVVLAQIILKHSQPYCVCLFLDAFSKARLQAKTGGHGSAQGRTLCLRPEVHVDGVTGKAGGLCLPAPAPPAAGSEPCSEDACGDRSARPQHPVWKQRSD